MMSCMYDTISFCCITPVIGIVNSPTSDALVPLFVTVEVIGFITLVFTFAPVVAFTSSTTNFTNVMLLQ